MGEAPRTALRVDALAWAYEPIAMRICRARAWRPAVVAAATAPPAERILDLGCGPGTLCRMLAEAGTAGTIVGVEPDPVMLDRARRAGGATVRYVRADATALPATPPFDVPFDVCVSTLMFHHLLPAQKRAALGEALRVLVPGGRLVVADWGPPRTRAGRVAFAITQVFDGVATTRDHADGGFEALLAESGVVDLAERGHWPTAVGTLRLYTARKP